MTKETKAAAQQALAKRSGKGNAPAKTPLTLAGLKSSQVTSLLEAYRGQMANVLPKHVSPDRMLQVATTLIMQNPDIANCTTQSLIGGLLAASITGLEPTPQLGLCYFVPFKNKKNNNQKEVQFIIGYKGMVQLARNSGQVKTVYAEPVFENDHFEYELGLDPSLIHRPAEGERGSLTHAYAVIRYKDEGYNFVVLSKADIDKIRNRSAAGKSSYSPWATDYAAMARKTAVRQVFKWAPVSIENNMLLDGAKIDANQIKSADDVNPFNAEHPDAYRS